MRGQCQLCKLVFEVSKQRRFQHRLPTKWGNGYLCDFCYNAAIPELKKAIDSLTEREDNESRRPAR